MSLFKDNSTNRMQVVLNICTQFAVPYACVDELLKLLKYNLLPKENTCPKSHCEAKEMVKKLVLSYHTIHVCKDDHFLLRIELKDAKKCHECMESQNVPKLDTILVKMLRHFTLIPHLL